MGKGVMFLMFIWMLVVIAANVMEGHTDFVRTTLTADLTDSGTTITVHSTEGFGANGIIIIGSEHIAYSSKTSDEFKGNFAQPMVRGAEGTTKVAHAAGVQVTTKSGAWLNDSASYNIAVMSDPSGIMAFVALPLALISLLGSFFFLPLQFLGTDLQFLTFLWAIIGVGMIVAIVAQIGSGRRI